MLSLDEWTEQRKIASLDDILALSNKELAEYLMVAAADINKEIEPTRKLALRLIWVMRTLNDIRNADRIARGFLTSIEKEVLDRKWKEE